MLDSGLSVGVSRCYVQSGMYISAGENFQSSMPQTKHNLLDQNLVPNHIWGQLGAGKVWPQAILGPGPVRLTGRKMVDPTPDQPPNWFGIRF